jgi:tRNA/tmRNA/rRNA uracil-C5-methylase (TrmA/RlmC/RlmD family)
MRIRVEKIVYPGRRLGLFEGKVVFTDRGLPGETVEVEVFKDRRSYAEARTVRIVEPSPDRVAPRCGHYLACSPYQDMDYGLETGIKRGQVAEILSRELKRPIANIELTPSPEIWGYRNKIGLRVLRDDGQARFVYHEPGEQASFVSVDRCYLVPDRVNDLLAALLGAINGVPLRTVDGLEIRTSRWSGESLVLCDLASEAEREAAAEAWRGLRKEFGLAGVVDLRRQTDPGRAAPRPGFHRRADRRPDLPHRGAVLLPDQCPHPRAGLRGRGRGGRPRRR